MSDVLFPGHLQRLHVYVTRRDGGGWELRRGFELFLCLQLPITPFPRAIRPFAFSL